MGEILPFMELEGYRRLKELEDANRKLRAELEEVQTKLRTETLLRTLYEKVAHKRLQKITDLEEYLKNDDQTEERSTGDSEVFKGRGQKDQTAASISERSRAE